MRKTFYRKGDYNIIDDRTGFKIKRSQARMTWDNLLVDKRGWEIRHPQDFLKGKSDNQSVSQPRTEGEDSFLSPGDVTIEDL